jgi:hypothetical protein
MGNAAYIAPISPRSLPTNMRQNSTPQGPQFAPMDVSGTTSSVAYAVVNASRITGAGFLCVWSGFLGFLRVVYSGKSIWCFTVYGRLVLLYYIPSVGSSVIYPALVRARSILALTSATPGMPYAVHVRALAISKSGRSRSLVKPTVCSVRSQIALRTRVLTLPTRSTATPRRPHDPRRPAWARDFVFLMHVNGVTVEVGAGGPKVLGQRVGRCRVQDI